MAVKLEEIIAFKKKEIEDFKRELPLDKIESRLEIINDSKALYMAEHLRNSNTGIIAEFKRRSPSRGWINRDASAKVIPLSYENNGATAISIHTDANFYAGSSLFIRNARTKGVKVPILYRNFIIDEYQVYQARLFGANAIQLIAACLTKEACRSMIAKAHELKMEVLLEIHYEEEADYIGLEPDMCGICNRDLNTDEVDISKSYQLVNLIPDHIVKVSEDGLSDPDTVRSLRNVGYKGFLIGEYFMMSPDPGQALQTFISHL